MLKKPTPVFNRLLDRIGEMPVVDCHEHLRGPERELAHASFREPILALVKSYLIDDLWSAGASRKEIDLLESEAATTDEKWPVFSRLWAATEHTAYARAAKLMLEAFGIKELTRQALDRIAEQRAAYDSSRYLAILQDTGIRAIIADALYPPSWNELTRYAENPLLAEFLNGEYPLPEVWHPVFPLAYFHELRHCDFVEFVASLSDSTITSLKDYEEAVFGLIEIGKDRGVVALKDQSAYRRVISYDLPARSEAERLFNRLLIDPRNQLAWPDAKPLDDHLFHQTMRFARQLDLPVQIHTGHVADIRNPVGKANAAYLAPTLGLHPAVRFDLFHGNWPYMGDFLFLGKNYPNVGLDLCWVHIIDPLYVQELLKRAVMTVPHTKIHGFGGDYSYVPELTVAHLVIAREVIAAALADLVECGWLEEEEALRLGADWLYNNPNRFFNLGLPPYEV